ncbi:MAG: Phage protein Gp37/Gp68 [Syntrophorhabdus sp. PtaU1.Bin050]|nr:MAG: Phage protein Gp37/Gp68 [Syntrophorhabdus sp. PtaU1.Bin050]
MQKTNISYLTHTWNPIAMRCTRVSEGCRECWHLRTADRLSKNPGLPEDERRALAGEGPFILRERELLAPLGTKKPAVIGVQFMGDLFHEDVPDSFRDDVYAVMHGCDRHTYLALTKRADNLLRYLQTHFLPEYQGRDHIYHGLTICNQPELDAKIGDFLKVPGRKFLSLEPMLGPIAFPAKMAIIECPTCGDGERWTSNPQPTQCYRCGEIQTIKSKIDAVVLGGETLGNRPGRNMKLEWVESIAYQCKVADVSLFIKQLHINGKLSFDMNEWPEHLRIRQLPWRTQ